MFLINTKYINNIISYNNYTMLEQCKINTNRKQEIIQQKHTNTNIGIIRYNYTYYTKTKNNTIYTNKTHIHIKWVLYFLMA